MSRPPPGIKHHQTWILSSSVNRSKMTCEAAIYETLNPRCEALATFARAFNNSIIVDNEHLTRLLDSWISPPRMNSSSIKYTCSNTPPTSDDTCLLSGRHARGEQLSHRITGTGSFSAVLEGAWTIYPLVAASFVWMGRHNLQHGPSR